MELREAFEFLRKYRRVVLFLSLVVGLGVLLVSLWLPTTYDATLTLYIRRAAQPLSSEFYNFDGYYSQQAAERYTDTVVGLLEDRGTVRGVVGSVGLSTDQRSLKKLLRSIAVTKTAPQLIELRVRRSSSEEAQQLAGTLAREVAEKVQALNEMGDQALSLGLLNAEPIVEERRPLPALNTVVGFLSGFLLSILVSALWEYLQGS